MLFGRKSVNPRSGDLFEFDQRLDRMETGVGKELYDSARILKGMRSFAFDKLNEFARHSFEKKLLTNY